MIALLSASRYKASVLIALLTFSLFYFSYLLRPPKILTLAPASHANYIVKFKEYKDPNRREEYLEGGVSSDSWEWIERRNSTMAYPTDFGVVAIAEPEKRTVLSLLTSHPE